MGYTTWNSADKAANISLSNGDLTATRITSTSWGAVRAVRGLSSGKYYWELTINSVGDITAPSCGIANSTADVTNGHYIGEDANGWVYYKDGQKYTGGSGSAYGDTFTTNDVIGVALDMDAGKVWFSKNGSWQASGDPAAGTNEAFSGLSGTIYPATACFDHTPADQITANFGASAFAHSAPSGFASGISDGSVEADESDGVSMGDTVSAFSLSDAISEGAVLGDTTNAYSLSDTISEGAVLSDTLDPQAEYNAPSTTDGAVLADSTDGVSLSGVISDAADLGDTAAGYAEVQRSQSDGAVFSDSSDGFNFSAWLAANRDKITVHYECTLTGAEDGVADAELPMSSFQARMNTGVQYLSVIVPGATYASTINARSNGQLYVEKVAYLEGVESLRVEVCRVDLEGIRVDEGAKRASITLDGHGYKTFPSQTTALQAVTYRMSDSGTYTYRMAYPDWYMKPGFTATYDNNSITVSQVTINVNANQAVMEVTNG